MALGVSVQHAFRQSFDRKSLLHLFVCGERPGATPSRQVSQGLWLLIPHASRLRQQDGLPITNVGNDGNPTEGLVQHVGHDTFVCHPRRLGAGIHLKRNQERCLITHDGNYEEAR